MEARLMFLCVALLALLATATHALPAADSVLESNEISADKRPKYMDTRDLDIFKYMLMASIRELVEEGKLNPAVVPSQLSQEQDVAGSVAKRMKYMGICMKRHNNSFYPYPCLRSE